MRPLRLLRDGAAEGYEEKIMEICDHDLKPVRPEEWTFEWVKFNPDGTQTVVGKPWRLSDENPKDDSDRAGPAGGAD
jgi:hypothetical protein